LKAAYLLSVLSEAVSAISISEEEEMQSNKLNLCQWKYIYKAYIAARRPIRISRSSSNEENVKLYLSENGQWSVYEAEEAVNVVYY